MTVINSGQREQNNRTVVCIKTTGLRAIGKGGLCTTVVIYYIIYIHTLERFICGMKASDLTQLQAEKNEPGLPFTLFCSEDV